MIAEIVDTLRQLRADIPGPTPPLDLQDPDVAAKVWTFGKFPTQLGPFVNVMGPSVMLWAICECDGPFVNVMGPFVSVMGPFGPSWE